METIQLPPRVFASKQTWKIYGLDDKGIIDFLHPLPVSTILNYRYAGENSCFEVYELKETKTLVNNEGEKVKVNIDTYLEVKQLQEEGVLMTLIKDIEGKTHSIIVPNQKF